MTATIAQLIRARMNECLIERDDTIDALTLGLVAGQNVLLVGPPGTAKSHVCRALSACVAGARYCERLLSPSTAPEALFGPISLRGLREDRYEYMGTGTFTDSHIVFADEVFRASDAILDSLLHLFGSERQALIGTQQVRAPLICAVGASNTWADSAHNAAILDRWLIRLTVKPVSASSRARLLFDALPEAAPVCTLEDVQALGAHAARLPIGNAARDALLEIIARLHAAGIQPSDRRARASLSVARAAAAIDGAPEVLPTHLEPLRWVLWDNPAEHPEKASEIVMAVANPTAAKINALLGEVDGILGSITDQPSRLVAIKKLEQSERDASDLITSGNGRATKAHAFIKSQRSYHMALACGVSEDKAAALLGATK